ncbi:MAG: DUF262 domain-containing HNH endonuclease family protein [Parabacteroides sp.]|nr:DUF262 domain-containing HNH endonuclease family protein [Parabacteroides sp.]
MAAINLSELFNNKIFRIPDYQRGYAWSEKQLTELWDDIDEIKETDGELKKHYTGTIFLETTKALPSENWISGYTFYNVVDGQQRLTTLCILLFELLNSTETGYCEESKSNLFQTFIAKANLSGASKVYKFGYDITDKNHSFLFNSIFEDKSVILEHGQLNLYRKNLLYAKDFFKNKIASVSLDEKELIFKKLTTSLQFDLRTIEKDLDVQAVFETMNNRGKQLTTLEKLKNRLIYLTDKLANSNEDKINLRAKINVAWGNIYSNLAQNPDNILDEDEFLSAHLSLYRKPKESTFSEKLAEEKVFQMFCNKSEKYDLDESGSKEESVSYSKIEDYVIKLSGLAPVWYKIHNSKSPIIQKLLILNSSKDIKIFLATLFLKFSEDNLLNDVLINLEKILFRNRVPGIWVMDERNPANWARDLYNDEESMNDILNHTNELIQKPINNTDIINGFRGLFTYINGNKGFHRWGNLKYFLFEYEQYLKIRASETNDKVSLADFYDTTIEHVIPQTYWTCWSDIVDEFTNPIEEELKNQARKVLINTLGNLTILKNGKNSALGNKSWIEKKERYRTGSYNEIEISNYLDWTLKSISERGFDMLKFMESKISGLTFTKEDMKKALFYDDYIIQRFE